jgi:hypothetical protein
MSGIIGKKPFQLATAIFAEHKAFVKYCRDYGASCETERDPQITRLTQSYLKMLASPNGNDILEEVCVRATGREPKTDDTKHGADSADGELEAKPMKTAYNAHISDDTPASLMRHQTIPYILLAEWTKCGTDVLWALITSYRVFDNSRYRGILATFPPEFQGATELPKDHSERRKALEDLILLRDRLIKERNIPRYVRSNALPIEDLASLQPGQYAVWSDASLQTSRGKAHKVIWKLAQAQAQAQAHGTFTIDNTFVEETEAIRLHFTGLNPKTPNTV